MTHRFAELMFSPAAKALQEEAGSRASYARLAPLEAPANDRLSARETDFISGRDSFYIASVTPDGWPYVQHRGGRPGFLKVLDDRTLGFADYRGNKQFVTFGNLATDDRVSLFLMDYPHRRRLKILGHARTIDLSGDAALADHLYREGEPEAVSGTVISLEGFDWNCPQYITPRYTNAELVDLLAPVRRRISELELENAQLRRAAPSYDPARVSPDMRGGSMP